MSLTIGIIATRLAGNDGVSLETAKWVQVMEQLGHRCVFFAGEANTPAANTRTCDLAHFQHTSVRQINENLFLRGERNAAITDAIEACKRQLKQEIDAFIEHFKPDCLLLENVLSLPVHVPLGIAVAEYLAETDYPAIAHHHDFWWERQRFLGKNAQDFMRQAFPPTTQGIRHVVINTIAQRQVAYRAGLPSTVIPNVMDFNQKAGESNQQDNPLRKALNIPSENYLLLQPTRIVPRKNIEKTIELAHFLGENNTVLITHEAGDEGTEYRDYIQRMAEALKVDLRLESGKFGHHNQHPAPQFSLAQAYQSADIVTYPSRVEGFGNAFLEAIYYKRPIVMNAYEIYSIDIEPKGFELIEMQDFPTREVISKVKGVLKNKDRFEAMTDKNFALGKRHFSYENLRSCLENLLKETMQG